jgi:hypothetical protein
LDQSELTFQVCYPRHETVITPNKKIETHYEAQFLINSLLNDEIKKKSILKKRHNKTI